MSAADREAFLGIDTSNYTTSAALYFTDGTYVSSRKLLPVPEGGKGLRQSDAVFAHVKQFGEVIGGLGFTGVSIGAVGVSEAPRNTAGSYMPCFCFGLSAAQAIAATHRVPCVRFSHQQGHIAAGILSCGKPELLYSDFYAFHASGGTTELVEVNGIGNISIISATKDISVGQLIDRTGVMLGMSFPCGRELESLCEKSKAAWNIRIVLKDGSCCLSGYENRVKDMLSKGVPHENIARYAIDICGKTVLSMIEFAENTKCLPVLCAGGVMANARIKKIINDGMISAGMPAPGFASPELSGDNAVGIAYLTYVKGKRT